MSIQYLMQLKTLGSVAGIVKSLGDGARSFQEVTAAVEGLTLAQTRAFISTTSLEAEEIKAIFAAKGLEGAELQEAVAATVNAQAHYKLGGAIGGVGNAFKGLAMVIKANPILTISSVFLLVIAGLNKIKQSIDETAEELRTKAAESADTLTESLSNLGDYQKRIEELKDAINSDDISQSEATEKRKQLLEIQEELIKKYGKEKEAIDYITESIQGETAALGNLQTIAAQNYLNNNIKQIEEANNYLTKLNEQTAPLPMTPARVGYNPDAAKYEAYADLVSKQIAPMAELLYTDAGKTTVNGISFKGNYEELISQYDEVLSNIRKYLSDNPINGNSSDEEKWQAEKLKELESYISGLRSRIDNDEELQKYQKIYNTALDSVLLTSNTYSEYYNKLIEAKNKYTEALTSGNQDEITKSYTELRNLFNEIFNLDFVDEDNVSGESIKAWFEDIQEKINLQSKETPIIIDIQAELKDSPDGYTNKIKEIAAKNNYTSGDIDAIISKGDLPGQTLSTDEQTVYDNVKGYVDLWNSVAEATGQSELKVEQYIDILEKLGIVQKEVAEGSESSFALSKDQTKKLKSVHSDVDKLNKAYQNLFAGKLTTNDVAELVDLFPTLGEYVDWTDEKFGNLAEGIDKVIKERPADLIKQLEDVLNTQGLSDEAKKSIQSMIAALKQLKPELKDTKTLIEDIQKAIKGVSSSISTLIGFTKEISSDGALSLSSIDTIMTDDTYQSLRPYINDMEGMQTAITELVAKQKDAYEDLYNAEMYENDYEAYRAELDKKEAKGEAYLNNSVKEIQNEIKNIEQQYNVDLTNWDNLSETKKTILQNTNAELLSKQASLINTFKSYYDTDLTNYKDTLAAKVAILENFRKSEAFAQVSKIATEEGNLHMYQGTLYLDGEDAKKKIDTVLASSGLTWEDYVQYLNNGTFTSKGNEALQKILDEIVKAYTITPPDWDKMTANIKSTGGSSSSSSSSKNYIDWIEHRLKKFAQTTKEIFARVADYISFNNQNSQLRKAINAIRDEIAVNEQSYQYYMDEANKVGLDPYWQWFVQNGARNISDIQDEALREKISRYKDLYDNAINCKNAVEDLKKTEKEYAIQMLSNVEKYYSNRITYANADAEYYNSLDTDNIFLNKNYDAIRKSYNEQISYTQKQHDDLLNTLNSLVSSGSIKYQSDEWYEWWDKIQKCNVEVRNLKKNIHDLANEELQDVKDFWDNYISVIDNDIKELENQNKDSTRATNMDYDGLKNDYRVKLSYLKKEADELNARLNSAVSNGDIEKYSDKWYEWKNKISDCKNEVIELRTSLHELDIEFLNERKTFWENRLDRIESNINKQTAINENSDRIDNIGTVIDKLYNLNKSKKIELERELINLRNEFQKLDIQKYSKEWYEWQKIFEDLEVEIINVDNSISDLSDTLRDIPIDRMKYVADIISKMRTLLKDVHSLHEAQGYEKTANEIYQVINSGQEQIEALSQEAVNIVFKMSNGLYGKEGSKQWKEALEEVVNIYESIYSVQIEQEQEYDKLIDLEINALNKQKEQLQEQNSELEKKLSLEKAIESLERARYQKNKLIYREGVGFVYEEDKNAVRDAQQELDNQYHQQVLDYFDKAVEALQEFKKNHNVYDYKGTQFSEEAYNDNSLKTNKYIHGNRKYNLIENTLFKTLPNASDLYKSLFSSDISNIVTQTQTDLLKKSINGFTNNFTNNRQNAGTVLNLNIEKGAITLHDVNDVQSLSKAIINQFPLQVMQDINKKR